MHYGNLHIKTCKISAEKILTDKKNPTYGKQIIINVHDGLLHSGGLTDRLKGMCTLYAFAKKENYIFKIFFISPFRLEKYLLPNIYDWMIDEESISYDLNTTAIYTWENEAVSSSFFRQNDKKQQLHIACNSSECAKNYSEIFTELFKPSPLLAEELRSHTNLLGGTGRYISISLRFQNLLGEFEEAESTSLSPENQKLLINQCLEAIVQIKEVHADIEKILVTSDSNLFRELVTKKFDFVYTYILPEEVGHIDYAEAGKGKELTAFLDMYLIAGAKKAYQVRNANMYNSDFPNMAAKINNVPYEMILLD